MPFSATYLPVTRGQVQRALRAETLSVLNQNWRAGLINEADVASYVAVIDEGNFPTDKPLIVDAVRQAIVDFQASAPANLGPSTKPIGSLSGLEGLEGFLGSIWKGVKKVAGAVVGVAKGAYSMARGMEQKKAAGAIEYHTGITAETFAPAIKRRVITGTEAAARAAVVARTEAAEAAILPALPVGFSGLLRSPVVLVGLGLVGFFVMKTMMRPERS